MNIKVVMHVKISLRLKIAKNEFFKFINSGYFLHIFVRVEFTLLYYLRLCM